MFRKLFNNRIQFSVFGAKTSKDNNIEILKNETHSIKMFIKTFENTDLSDVGSIRQTMAEKHPYYNGDNHPRIDPSVEFC